MDVGRKFENSRGLIQLRLRRCKRVGHYSGPMLPLPAQVPEKIAGSVAGDGDDFQL
jgi:hypothetical protein